jgi:hypothetical protein
MLAATSSSAQMMDNPPSTYCGLQDQWLRRIPKEPNDPPSTRRAGARSFGRAKIRQAESLRMRPRGLLTPRRQHQDDRQCWRRADRPGLPARCGWISPAIGLRQPTCLPQSAPTTGKSSQWPLLRCQPAAESSVEPPPCSTSPAGVPRQQRCKEAVRRCRRYVPRAAEEHSFPTPILSEEKATACRRPQNDCSPSATSNALGASADAATSVRIVSERAFESSAACGCQLR